MAFQKKSRVIHGAVELPLYFSSQVLTPMMINVAKETDQKGWIFLDQPVNKKSASRPRLTSRERVPPKMAPRRKGFTNLPFQLSWER